MKKLTKYLLTMTLLCGSFTITDEDQKTMIDRGTEFINECFAAMEDDLMNSLTGNGPTNNCDRVLNDMDNWTYILGF